MGETAKRKPKAETDIEKIAANANIKPIKKEPKATIIANNGMMPAAKPASRKAAKSATTAYLTSRVLNSAVKRAFKNAAAEAMQVMGYIMIAEDGWVIKLFADGTKEKIKEMEVIPRPETIILY